MAQDKLNQPAKFEVEIAGVTLILRSEHKKEMVEKLVSKVDQSINDYLKKDISFQNALLLTSLNYAEELVTLKSAAKEELSQIKSQAQQTLINLEDSTDTRAPLDN